MTTGVVCEAVPAVLSRVEDDLRVLQTVPLEQLSRDCLIEAYQSLETARRLLAPVEHRLIDQYQARDVAGELGFASTAALLSAQLRINPAEALVRVKACADLASRTTITGAVVSPRFARVAAAQGGGAISSAHAAVITHAITRIPLAVEDEYGELVESTLVEQALHTHPAQVAAAARQLLDRIDPDGTLADERDHIRRRDVTLTPNVDGSGTLSGHLTPVLAEKLRTILDPLAAPAPAADGTRDTRTPGQRRHDGLDSMCDRLLHSGDLPDCGGIPTTVLLRSTVEQWNARCGLVSTGHDAFLPVGTAHDLADEAKVVIVVENEFGRVVATETVTRIASKRQRLALVARDGGCSFPGCDAPPSWTQAHHVVEWSHGGPTTLANLTLVCGHHHRTFAASGWSCTMTEGVPHWIPPSFIDPTRTPRRNLRRALEPPGQ